ncbi:MAG: DUF116 domain-containing protein [Candidatus Diapherotrites archaeon]|nr:DUF116 domain-containing protein [Candidatus Diapherotrites archaeon]
MGFVSLIGVIAIGVLLLVLSFTVVMTIVVYAIWRTRNIILPEVILALMNIFDYPVKRTFWFFKIDTEAVDLVKTVVMNKIYEKQFSKIPPQERLIVLPQCLRHVNCPARLDPNEGIVCVKCGLCGIANIKEEAEALGEKVVIVPGGTFAARMMKKFRPKAVIGVACPAEIREGAEIAMKHGIIPQTVPLLRSGCVNTAVDWDELKRVMKLGIGNAPDLSDTMTKKAIIQN